MIGIKTEKLRKRPIHLSHGQNCTRIILIYFSCDITDIYIMYLRVLLRINPFVYWHAGINMARENTINKSCECLASFCKNPETFIFKIAYL